MSCRKRFIPGTFPRSTTEVGSVFSAVLPAPVCQNIKKTISAVVLQALKNEICFDAGKGKISLLAALWSALAGGLYHMHLVGEMTAKRAGHGFLARMDAAERENFLQDFAGLICKKIRPQGLETIRKHQSQGDAVILCSASCACYMRHVARYLGVDALLCTPTDAQGQPQPPNCKRGEKVRRITQWLEKQGSDISAMRTAYGDSAGDVQMLSACKTPVLVHPKRALRRAFPQAERVSWPEPKHP